MTQELIVRSLMEVAKARGLGPTNAVKHMGLTKGEFNSYLSGQNAFHFDKFFACCYALRVSPHNILARAQMEFEKMTKVRIRQNIPKQ